ncbi:MAG TPA: hypothetical protein VM370_09095 [Candidatus Thermoplasmatota archaeon]|nr:hypothetical protein [Candidatus Thermoplasmatota archaeon]
MRWWLGAATVAAIAFVEALAALIASLWLPVLREPARAFVVGSGSMLAAFTVVALYTALLRQVEAPLRDTRPLVSMHPRRR